jgi:hypothetical protein
MQHYILLIGVQQSFFQSLTWAVHGHPIAIHQIPWPLNEDHFSFMKSLSPSCFIFEMELWNQADSLLKNTWTSEIHGSDLSSIKHLFIERKIDLTDDKISPENKICVPIPILKLRDQILGHLACSF